MRSSPGSLGLDSNLIPNEVRLLQNLVIADCTALKSALSFSLELSSDLLWIMFAFTHPQEIVENSLSQTGTLDKLASSCWILQLQTRLQNKTKQNKLTSNTNSPALNMWDASLDPCSFPVVKHRHTSSVLS